MKKRMGFLLLLLVLIVLGGYGYWRFGLPEPKILKNYIKLSYGEPFRLEDRLQTSKDVTLIKVVKGSFDSRKIGKQRLTIEAKNNYYKTTSKVVIIEVVDEEAPMIESKDFFFLEANQSVDFNRYVKVKDNADIKPSLHASAFSTGTLGEQVVTLTAIDSSKNKTEKSVRINVIDTIPPAIYAENQVMIAGESFDARKNAVALDAADGDISGNIQVSGNVNGNQPGTYSVTYKVKDSSGNERAKTIQVTVIRRGAGSSPSVSGLDTSKLSPFEPLMIYFSGKAVPYENAGFETGQAIINSKKISATWGGEPVFSGTDAKNTHFIGHHPGYFTGIEQAKTFTITDANGTPFTYLVMKVYQVDDSGNGIKDGLPYFPHITGTDGGERVTLQTCLNNDVNWIVEAY